MKYLEYTPHGRINDFLSHVNLGERTIKGCLEAYSCKHTGTDKKLSFSLEREIQDYLGSSSDADSSLPVEYFCGRSSQKTLVYLVLALYHMYPDYDFSMVKAHQFFAEESWDSFKQVVEAYMIEASKEWVEVNEEGSLLDTLYKVLDEVVQLSECDIYSYNPDCDADPFLEKGSMQGLLSILSSCEIGRTAIAVVVMFGLYFLFSRWSCTFFFYNRKLKRVATFRFSCLSNLVAEGSLSNGLYYGNDEIFDVMDMERFDDMDM